MGSPEPIPVGLAVFRRNDQVQRFPDGIRGRVTERLLGAGAPKEDNAG
jgi:hypothetical protein